MRVTERESVCMCVHLYVCMCVCVCEREREGNFCIAELLYINIIHVLGRF